jgi:CDP-diacylglycerol--glycerol-3-phosphate 3-phosphatidyltransferase
MRGRRVTLYELKPRFQALLRPMVGRMAAAGITANQITIGAMVGSLLVGAVVARWAPARMVFLLIPVWLLVRMALNAVDGMLAREHNQQSKLGAYLNEICDVVSDAALYAPFIVLPAFGGFWVGTVILLAALTEFAGVLGPSVGASRRYDGPLGKSDRALLFGALGLWVGLHLPLPDAAAWLMVLVAVLLAFTVVNRVRKGLAEGQATRPTP